MPYSFSAFFSAVFTQNPVFLVAYLVTMDERFGKRGAVFHGHEEAVLPGLDGLSATCRVGRDDRAAHGQRFEQDPRKPLPIGRQHDPMRASQDRPDILRVAEVTDDAEGDPF